MTSKDTGQTQATLDLEEIEIAEENQKMNENLKVIENTDHNLDSRQGALGIAKHYLDGQEYDLPRITAEINAHLSYISQGYMAVGRLLLAVKAVEGHGNFTKWLAEHFPSSPRTARNYMLVAKKLEQRPELARFANAGVEKAMVLLDLPEDYQSEYIEKGSIDGEPFDKLITMSHKELREELKKLKSHMDKEIAEETKALTSERDMLNTEIKRLKQFEPTDEKPPEWSLEHSTKIEKAVFSFSSLCQQFILDERLKDNMPLQANIETHMTRARKEIDDIARSWDEMFNPVYEG